MPIDLRSDTVTQPSEGMRRAIANAAVGDDVFGDDPTVNDLEHIVADLFGTEAAVFVTSGTQSNLCALMAHCGRGDEYIVGDHAHAYWYEAGGAAVLGSIQPQPVRMLADGLVDPAHVRDVIKADDPHFARTKLVCLENTQDGKVQSAERMAEATTVAREFGLHTHLDGARIWNASVALETSLRDLVAGFDTVSVCLSKGLGAPAGSVLCGTSELVQEARKWRKMLGGGLRQAGVLAAAGMYAVANNIDRMAEDHENAARFATGLADISGATVLSNDTNMVFARLDFASAAFESQLAERGVIALVSKPSARFVTHLGISRADVDLALATIAAVAAAQ